MFSWFPKPVGPRAAFADLLAFMRQRSREKVIGAMLAVLVTAINLDLGAKIWWPSKIDTGGNEALPPHADEEEKVLV